MDVVPILHTVFGVLGDASGFFLFLAPAITFKRILKNKSTQQFSGIPYAMTLLNCLLFAWYGLPFVSENNTLVTVINGTGAGIEAIYVLIFLIYAPKKEKAKVLGLLTFVLAAFSTTALVSVFALHGKRRRYFCGFAAAIFSVIMYGSPLSIMDKSDRNGGAVPPARRTVTALASFKDSDQDQESGIYAIFPVTVRFLV
ncbi:bidirectional sugar transporter SWEET1-like protein [Tanacetum coccineum]